MSLHTIASALAPRRARVLQAGMVSVDDSKVPSRSQSILVLKAAVTLLLLAAVLVAVAYRYGASDILAYLRQLSPAFVGLIALGLLANAMLAVLRFQVLASDAVRGVVEAYAMRWDEYEPGAAEG